MSAAFSDADYSDLCNAHSLLENPGLAARLTSLIGSPIDQGLKYLPDGWNRKISEATKLALVKAADAAIFTMKDKPGGASSNRLHKFGVATTGGVGGFFGLAGLSLELPVSTTIMMRSIADIARSEGESLSDPDTRLACLAVFALGGESASDDSTESGYYVVRAALARAIGQAAQHASGSAMASHAAPPAIMRLITLVAERFGVQISEKVAAQAVPAIGAAGGAVINTLFIDHFQDMARGHFIIRRLERSYGSEAVRMAYQSLTRDT